MRRLALVFLAAGCVDSTGPVERTGAERSAIGEPMNGFPSPIERLGIMAINRARSDPATVAGPSSAAYPARPPVLWSYPLSRSARFQAINLQLSDVTLMHTSPCPLNTDVATSGCTGDPTCACATPVPAMCASCAKVDATNTCGTDPFVRIAYFTSGMGVSASGEVAAAGYGDPMAVVDGWMDEASGADGHRKNLTDQGIKSNTMGYGHSSGSTCWSTFDFSDSGNVTGAQIPKLPTAAVKPPSGAAGTFTFYATWADPTLGAPSLLNVVVDGNCTPMTRELGADNLNATYKIAATLAAGCHSYYIAGKDASGAAINYPTTGALTIAVGGTACSGDYLTAAPSASCATPTDGGQTGTGGAAAMGTGGAPAGGAGGVMTTGGTGGRTAGAGGATTTGSGTGGATATGTGGAISGGTGGARAGAGGGAGSPPVETASGGCGCSLRGGRRGTGGPLSLALLAGLLVRTRRRDRGDRRQRQR